MHQNILSNFQYRTCSKFTTGLDEYEPLFGRPIQEWTTAGDFTVSVTIPEDTTITQDLFYFCHIHRYLGGRIKLFRDGKPIQPHANLPVHAALPPPQSEYDEHCGTYGLVHEENNGWMGDSWPHNQEGDHRLPHPECPHTFVCEEDKSTFASCLDAINCHMFNGMTTYENYNEVQLFIIQMIPHHQNAVNMAKSLLSHWDYECDPEDLGEDSDECIMENIIRSIINGQNAQIQTMRDVLKNEDWPEFQDCDVPLEGSVEVMEPRDYNLLGPWFDVDWHSDGHDDGGRHHRMLEEKTGGGNKGRGLGERAQLLCVLMKFGVLSLTHETTYMNHFSSHLNPLY